MKNDTLWKGIMEDLVEDFLAFFFPEQFHRVDFARGVEFLDKELDAWGKTKDSVSKNRVADKLIKVWMKDGQEQCFLIHVEVQGYSDKDFGHRMFQNYYPIIDRYGQPVRALAIYTDTVTKWHVDEYRSIFHDTELIYRFRSYSLIQQDSNDLRRTGNLFGFILEIARRAIDSGLDDNSIIKEKLELIQFYLSCGLNPEKLHSIVYFITLYQKFNEPESHLIFESKLDEIFKNKQYMGIKEAVLAEAKEQGIE